MTAGDDHGWQARTAGEQGSEQGQAAGSPEGVVYIEASCAYAAGLPAMAAVLADAIKGTLPGSPRPLQVRRCLTAPGSLAGMQRPGVRCPCSSSPPVGDRA